MFGLDLYKSRVLELNASDERGIGVVREKIKKFAQVAVTKSSNSNSPNFKIIVLDEADSLTSEAQAALRRVVEKYTKVTRFCLICNYISKIIDPLASRCAKFRFKPISLESHISRLQYISDQERIACTQRALECLIGLAEGDLRKSITCLQSASKLYGGMITDDNIREVASVIPDNIISSIYRELFNSFDSLHKFTDELIFYGYQPDVLLFQLFDFLISRQEISDLKKSKIMEVLGEADYGLVAGGNEYLQIIKALTTIQKIIKA